jgi:hypothetical protein
VYAPVSYEKDKVELSPVTSVQVCTATTAKNYRREFEQGSGARHSRISAQRPQRKLYNFQERCGSIARTQDCPATSSRHGEFPRQEEETDCATRRVPTPSTDGGSIGSTESHTSVTMLRKLLLVSPDQFERLRCGANPEAPRERCQMRGLLKTAHPYDKWVRLRELHEPLLRPARKKTRPLPLPIYGTG